MPDVHLFQWVVAFGAALWLTARLFLDRPRGWWRHIATGTVSTLAWIPVAYTAGNVHVASAGEKIVFGSDALGTFAAFMIVVNLVGLVAGHYAWAEEATDEAREAAADGQRRRGG